MSGGEQLYAQFGPNYNTSFLLGSSLEAGSSKYILKAIAGLCIGSGAGGSTGWRTDLSQLKVQRVLLHRPTRQNSTEYTLPALTNGRGVLSYEWWSFDKACWKRRCSINLIFCYNVNFHQVLFDQTAQAMWNAEPHACTDSIAKLICQALLAWMICQGPTRGSYTFILVILPNRIACFFFARFRISVHQSQCGGKPTPNRQRLWEKTYYFGAAGG